MHISWLFGEDSSPAPLVNTSKVERRTSEACGDVLNRKLDRKWDGQEGFTKRAVGRLCCTAHIHRKVPTTKKMEARLPLFVFREKRFSALAPNASIEPNLADPIRAPWCTPWSVPQAQAVFVSSFVADLVAKF